MTKADEVDKHSQTERQLEIARKIKVFEIICKPK